MNKQMQMHGGNCSGVGNEHGCVVIVYVYL